MFLNFILLGSIQRNTGHKDLLGPLGDCCEFSNLKLGLLKDKSVHTALRIGDMFCSSHLLLVNRIK